jgi:hypothetical protein
LPLCTPQPLTIERVTAAWAGAALDDELSLYASPPGKTSNREHSRFGSAPGKPPSFEGLKDMGTWVKPAEGASMPAIPCDAADAAGRFADLIVSGRTNGRGARVKQVTVTYTTEDGERYTESSSSWQIVLCGTDIQREPGNLCEGPSER